MSTQEISTVIGSSDYVPLADRQPDYGNATEDRQATDKHRDNQFTPVKSQTNEHELDARIDEFEQLAEQENRKDHLEPQAKRIANYFKGMKERDLDGKEATAAERKHTETVAPQLARLSELRKAMIEGEGWRVSQVVAIDKAIRQYGYGNDLAKAAEMAKAVEDDVESTLADRDVKLQAEIFGLQNKIKSLKAVRKQPELTKVEAPTGSDLKTKMFDLFSKLDVAGYSPEVLREVTETRKSGDESQMEAIIAKYSGAV